MEFAGFSDDLFEDEKSNDKAQVVEESNWTVHQSTPGVSFLFCIDKAIS